jgi:hypothetical protein
VCLQRRVASKFDSMYQRWSGWWLDNSMYSITHITGSGDCLPRNVLLDHVY